MPSFFSFLFKKRFPDTQSLATLTRGPLTLSRALFYGTGLALLIVAYIFLIRLNNSALVTVPARGGGVVEGVIGAPRFIHPFLATTDTDVALTHLVYGGLLKENADGSITGELAESYDISSNGQIYTFHLRPKIRFHDGTLLTSGDVAFTFEKLRDESLNPRTSAFWKELAVDTPDQNTVVVTSPAPQDEVLREMTMGILPSQRWEGVIDEAYVDPSLTLHPVGTGAFKVKNVSTDETGAVRRIDFVRNHGYALGAPLLSKFSVVVYANQDALLAALGSGAIDMTLALDPATLDPASVASSIVLEPIRTNNTVALFASSHEPLLRNAAASEALSRFVDKAGIVATVESSYGIPAQDVPRATLEETVTALETAGYSSKDGVLTDGTSPVTLAIATENNPSLIAAGRALSEQLATLGIQAQVQAFDRGTFQSGVANGEYPSVLATSDTMRLASAYRQGLPLYTKTALLATRGTVHGALHDLLASSTLRYSSIEEWHARYDRIWKWFIKE